MQGQWSKRNRVEVKGKRKLMDWAATTRSAERMDREKSEGCGSQWGVTDMFRRCGKRRRGRGTEGEREEREREREQGTSKKEGAGGRQEEGGQEEEK